MGVIIDYKHIYFRHYRHFIEKRVAVVAVVTPHKIKKVYKLKRWDFMRHFLRYDILVT